MRIAMCQIFALDGNRRGNFVRIENAVREVKEAGADLACLPEMAILGWVNPDAHKRACPIPGPDSDRLCKLADELDIYLCVGLAEKDGDRLYDSAILIDSEAVILSEAKNLLFVSQILRLRLRMTLTCHFRSL